jgi:hypothetical protein
MMRGTHAGVSGLPCSRQPVSRKRAPVELAYGEFIGTTLEGGSDREQRDDARRVYEQTLEKISVPGHNVGSIWNDVRDYWRSITAEEKRLISRFDPSEPRDEEGRWTDGGGSGESGSGEGKHPAAELQSVQRHFSST